MKVVPFKADIVSNVPEIVTAPQLASACIHSLEKTMQISASGVDSLRMMRHWPQQQQQRHVVCDETEACL